jgi:hypothetical protein
MQALQSGNMSLLSYLTGGIGKNKLRGGKKQILTSPNMESSGGHLSPMKNFGYPITKGFV